MKSIYLILAKIGSTALLGMGIFGCLTFMAMLWSIDAMAAKMWAGMFLVSAAFMLLGMIHCWRNTTFSKITIVALAYTVILYGYLNWVAPNLPEPIGFAGSNQHNSGASKNATFG